MGRQNNDPTVHSSIALLQERFRQLQRVKEMREEREFLRVFTEGERTSPSARYEQSKLFFHPDLIHPCRPLHGPPFLRLESHGDYMECHAFEVSPSMGLLSIRPTMHTTKNSDETDVVDTSLHL